MANIVVIDQTHSEIHKKNVFDFHHVFESLASGGTAYVSVRATTKELHIVFTIMAEGKARLKSYNNTVWSDDGTAGSTFNRYIGTAPTSTSEIYYDGSVTTLGTQRFDELLLGGSNPQSSGATQGDRIESIIGKGEEVTIEITNDSTSEQDYGVVAEWYEV